MNNKVFVVGNGMTKFLRPGREENPDYHELAALATKRALRDAGIPYSEVKQACVGYSIH
jgi:sterol carrier protein 2